MAILSVLGYGAEIDSVLGFLAVVLPITAGGGLVNKAIEASVEKKKAILEEGSLEKLILELKAQVEEAKKA